MGKIGMRETMRYPKASDAEKAFAEKLNVFWEFQLDGKIRECSGYDEWCEAQLYRTAASVITCVKDENRSLDYCIDREKRKLVGED